MKTKDKPNNNKDKDKKIILWKVKSFPAKEIQTQKEEMKKDKIQILWEVNSFPAIEIKFWEEKRED